MTIKKAIIIGATSGIGKEVAKRLSHDNFIVGMAGRRINLLEELQKELSNKTHIKRIDISKTTEAILLLEELIKEMGG